MPLSFGDNSWHWRYSAQRARVAAQRLSDPNTKETMLRVAALYAGLADRAEKNNRELGSPIIFL